jgi:pimeloyl-ACP methyl ester carboxylesterase
MALFPPSHQQVERFASMVGEDFSQLRYPEVKDLLVAMQRLPGVQSALRDLLHAVVDVGGARPEVALTAAALRRVRQPVQLIWGDHDAFGSIEVGRRAAAILPDAKLHVLGNAGHVPWVANPEGVSEIATPFLLDQARRQWLQ